MSHFALCMDVDLVSMSPSRTIRYRLHHWWYYANGAKMQPANTLSECTHQYSTVNTN